MVADPQRSLHDLLSRPDNQSAARLVRAPASVRLVALWLAMLLPVLLVGLLAMPWQQAALGVGRVIAFAPQEREQVIDAPVKGRIASWYVQEGQYVQEGDPLVEIVDNDPALLSRLEQQRVTGGDQRNTLERQIVSYEVKLVAAEAARDRAVAEGRSKVASLERKRLGIEAELEVESRQADRLGVLATEGITSRRDAELAGLKRDKARAELNALDREIDAARESVAKLRADGDAKVATVRADLDAARAKLAEQDGKLIELDSKVARQAAQLVRAPRSGTVLRLHGGPGGGQVKEGDRLVTLVPETMARAVELLVDGNDMPLVTEGEAVRLLFEGWPALQVVGFPGADAGTYAGVVAFVDATDDGSGRFRIVVTPDPRAQAWPAPDRLRQGVRVKGWVLLGQVSLAYELWRNVNGFPPLPPVEKGTKVNLPSSKKPRAPSGLK